jgi:hypothetical protein
MQWKLQRSDRILLDVMANAILGENQGNAVRADETPRSRADDFDDLVDAACARETFDSIQKFT